MAHSEHSFRNYHEIASAIDGALSQTNGRTSAARLIAIARTLHEKRPELNVDLAQLVLQVAEAAKARIGSTISSPGGP